MEEFCRESGQKMNVQKSKIWITPNIPLCIGRLLLRTFGVPITSDLGTYLGVSLQQGATKSMQFQYLIEKVHKRLSGWKKKLLS